MDTTKMLSHQEIIQKFDDMICELNKVVKKYGYISDAKLHERTYSFGENYEEIKVK